jgi:hypothetical protein
MGKWFPRLYDTLMGPLEREQIEPGAHGSICCSFLLLSTKYQSALFPALGSGAKSDL